MKKNNIIITILFLLTIIFMSVGFAQYGQIVNFNGTVVAKPDGIVYISSVEVVSLSTSGSTATATANPQIIDGSEVEFNLKFTTLRNVQSGYEAKFKITITNDSSYDYVYSMPNYSPTAYKGNQDVSQYIDYSIDGINQGEEIDAKGEKSFYITFIFDNPDPSSPGTYTIGGNFVPSVDESSSARIMGRVDETQEGNLRGNNELALFTVNVLNTYKVAKPFTIIVEGDKYVTRNLENTGTPQYTISANNAGENFSFYIAKASGAEFVSDRERVKVLIVPTGESPLNCGKVTILVDPTVVYTDTTPPEISNVAAVKNITEGSATVTWNGVDDSGLIDHYTILAYKNGSQVASGNTTSDEETYTFSGLSEGQYYFIVYGTDSSGNSASSSDITQAAAGNQNNYAAKSNDLELKWNYRFRVNVGTNIGCSGTGLSQSGQTYTATVKLGSNYTVTIRTTANNYNLPASGNVSVSYNNEAYGDYTYNRNTGEIQVNSIPGDIVVDVGNAVAQGCLAQGTRILLADDTYKNIEDIEYTDLLKVYDHVNGGATEVYPIFIEKEAVNSSYRKITFSDGTILNVINSHSLFDVDKREYVDVADEDKFKIGSRVYKFKNDKLEIVTVSNIEYITEPIKHYNILSTCYYNIIANDIITTDTTASISNIYGFEDNAIYGENYYKISDGEKLEYKDVQFLPYYLYKGFNLKNAKVLLQSDISSGYLEIFVRGNTKSPIVKNGKMYFSVTTALDKIDTENNDKYLYKEGSIYELPKYGAKYFIETSTNQIYNPGDRVKVEYSIYFRAVK